MTLHFWSLAVFILAMSAAAAPLRPLLRETSHTGELVARFTTPTTRSLNVTIDVERLRAGTPFEIHYLQKAPVIAVRDRGEKSGDRLVWIGHIAKERRSSLIFAVVGDSVAGTIVRGDGTTFQVRNIGKGVYVLEQFDNSRALPEGDSRGISPNLLAPAADVEEKMCPKDPKNTIDLLVVYTAKAKRGAGGTDPAIAALIDLAITETNESFLNSAVPAKAHLLYACLVEYDDDGTSLGTVLARLTTPGDGYLDEVHTLRDAYGADIVILMVENGDSAGYANIMESVSKTFHPAAFAVVMRAYATAYYSFGHEIGHTLGARHEWDDDPTDMKPDHVNHGYVNLTPTPPETAWRTMMTTPKSCPPKNPCRRVLFWSDPAARFPPVTATGDPLGVGEPKPTDDHATLKGSVSTVSQFRCRPEIIFPEQ